MLARPVLTVFIVLVGGCSMQPAQPHLSNGHPANPNASEAPLAVASQTLATTDTAGSVLGSMQTNDSQVKTSDSGADHGQMQHGAATDVAAAGMKHDGHDMSGMQHAASASPATRAGSSTTRAAAPYTCVMHPEVVSDAPGRCPKCGMQLVIKKK